MTAMRVTKRTLTGWVLMPQGWRFGELSFSDRLLGFAPDSRRAATGESNPICEDGEVLILPGFIDLHVHGGGGADVMDGGDAMLTVARTHARHGTTAMLATTMTAPTGDIDQALAGVAAFMRSAPADAAAVLGVHLEGPYINAEKLGAQPDYCLPGRLEDIERWTGLAPIRVVTLAPEIAGNMELLLALSQRGVRVQMGHSTASYEQTRQALAHGLSGFTHLFNAMSPLHQRNPGVVGAALAHAEYAELISDLVCVHPGAIRVALRAIPKLYAVTDATAAAGMPDGEYSLGRQRVQKCLGAVRLADGTLAGSALTTDQGFRNLAALPLPLADVSRRMSLFPAEYLGLQSKGRIEAGYDADLVVMDQDLSVDAVYVRGSKV